MCNSRSAAQFLPLLRVLQFRMTGLPFLSLIQVLNLSSRDSAILLKVHAVERRSRSLGILTSIKVPLGSSFLTLISTYSQNGLLLEKFYSTPLRNSLFIILRAYWPQATHSPTSLAPMSLILSQTYLAPCQSVY